MTPTTLAQSGQPARPAQPTAAFVGASWGALLTGSVAYLIGLWNAHLALSEKGYYLTLLLFGLFAAVSLQKSVRDRADGLAVTGLYLGLAWVAVIAALVLLAVGLWNAGMASSEKGFYAMAYVLSIFAAIAVQKNVRDLAAAPAKPGGAESGRGESGRGDQLLGELPSGSPAWGDNPGIGGHRTSGG